MFGRKTAKDLVPQAQAPTRDPGPKPDDIDPGPARPFLVIMRHGMPSLVVMGHGTDFGVDQTVTSRGGLCTTREGKFTKVWMSQPTTYYLGSEYVDVGKPRIPKWYPKTHTTQVFAARTDDIVMIVDKDNVKVEPEQ